MSKEPVASGLILGTIRGLSRSKFVRSVAVLSGGQVLAAAVPLVTAPILGRLYLPSEYGVLGAYMAVASVLAAVGNWQYALGIIVEKSDQNALVLVRLCYFTSLLTSLIALAIGIGIVCYPTESPPGQRIWFLLLPVSTLIGGITSARVALLNRCGRYGKMATVQVVSATATALISIGLGFAGLGYAGLLIAYFLGQFMVFVIYWSMTSQLEGTGKEIPRRRLWVMARKHKDFALFTTPGAFVSGFAMQLPIYALGFMGAAEAIGFFTRARQLLSMPVTLVGGAISQVFQRQAAAEYARVGNCKSIFRKTFISLVGVGLPPSIVLALFAPQIFAWFLGSNWREAGDIARVLAPMLLLRLLCSPLAKVLFITNSQREDFILSLAGTILTFTAVTAAALIYGTSRSVIIAFSISYSTTYLLYFWRSNILAQNVQRKIV